MYFLFLPTTSTAAKMKVCRNPMSPEYYQFEFRGFTAAKCVEISTTFHDVTKQDRGLAAMLL